MRAIRKRFPALDQNVTRFGYWWAVFGPGGVLSVLSTWVAKNVEPIAVLGWGAVVFAGIGAACIIMLVASVCLVAWRYFNPLPPAPPPELGSPALAQSKAPTIDKLPAVSPTNNPETERDVLILLDYAVYVSTVEMLDAILSSAPDIGDGPLKLGGNFQFDLVLWNTFIDDVRKRLDPGSWRRSNYEGVMARASNAAEHEVEQTPPDQRPAGIDPLALRKYAIVHRQCIEAIKFVRHQSDEAHEKLLGKRSDLLERYRRRNPN
jgi:hypothetical protein